MPNEHIAVAFYKESELPLNVVIPHQVHGDTVEKVVTGKEALVGCDALVTPNRALSLGVRTADCAPICFGNTDMIGIAHIGWRGLCLGLIEKMRALFPEDVEVFVGPHLHAFEIQKDYCYDAITQKFGEQFITEANERLMFDFRKAIASCLPPDSIFDTRNTLEDISLPSHRRDGTKDRLTTVVQFKNP